MQFGFKHYTQLALFVVGTLLGPSNIAAQAANNTIPDLPSTPIVDAQPGICPLLLYLPLIRGTSAKEEKAINSPPNAQSQITNHTILGDAHHDTQELQTFSPEVLFKSHAVPVVTSMLVYTEATSLWEDPSPDPSGIDSFGDQRVIISDSEVDEQPGKTVNIWVFDLGVRQVLSTTSTVTIEASSEPTDIAYTGEGVIITDDVNKKVISAQFGPDGNFDQLYSFDTRVYGSIDPEGADVFVANNNKYLVTSDASGNMVYIHHPGYNQRFDGPCPPGDDTIRKFNTADLGFFSPAGVFAAPDETGDSVVYYLVGERDRQHIYVVNANADHAELAYKIDIGKLSQYQKMAGIVIMPNGQIVLVFRGIDNDSDPDENDGILAVIQPDTGNMRVR